MVTELNTLKDRVRSSFALEERPFTAYSPLLLAYVGDAVYELVVRTVIAMEGNRSPKAMNKEAVRYVNAAAQAAAADAIGPLLTEEEADILRRGRNAHPATTAKHMSVGDYRKATGLEALAGYLYLSGREERLTELIKTGMERIKEADRNGETNGK